MSPDHDADIGVWCFCSDCENGWEKCPVPSCEGPQYQESLDLVRTDRFTVFIDVNFQPNRNVGLVVWELIWAV